MEKFITLPNELLTTNQEGKVTLDNKKLGECFDEYTRYKNVVIPDSLEVLETFMTLSFMCLLNVVIGPKLVQFKDIFWNSPVFECNMGGRIYYKGTRDEFEELLKSSKQVLDYTPYWDIVEFIDENFVLPEIDYHVKEDDCDGKEIEMIRYCEYKGNITIPTSYLDVKGKKHLISGIGALSFAFNNDLTEVVIPSEIDVICLDAFRECNNLEKVIICESDKPIRIEQGAFYNCEKLEIVEINRLAYIEKYAFHRKEGKFKTFKVVQNLDDREYIDEHAFN